MMGEIARFKEFRLRDAEPKDTPAIVDLCRAAGSFSESECVSAGNDIDDYQQHYRQRDGVLLWETEPHNQLAGFAHFSPAAITDGTWFIYWIAISKNFQGQGLGKELIHQAEQCVKAKAGRLVLIETSTKPDFEAARKLYTRMEYNLLGTIPDYFAVGDSKNIYGKYL